VSTAVLAAQTAATPLPAAAGWSAQSIHQAAAGVWYLRVDQVVDAFGQPEVIATDDQGRLLVLSVYSGQWTVHAVTCDGLWLAPTGTADVDPRVPGREIYAGGRAGSLHQITLRPQPFAKFTLESREIGHAAGEEFHTVLAADLRPGGGDELWAFGVSGALYELAPDGADGAFTMRTLAVLPGRVRDAIVVSGADGGAPSVLAVARSGHLLRLTANAAGVGVATVLREDCGLGRLAAAREATGVYYLTRDDGVVLRIAIAADGSVQRQPIFVGPVGLRGVAAGRFCADGREALAVYGYGATVHLLSRRSDGTFGAEELFSGGQKGHWLTHGELDGRNGTDELVASGFDGQVVLLARAPGYGLPGAAVAPEPGPASHAAAPRVPSPRARRGHRHR
jgi:hypothetical protein